MVSLDFLLQCLVPKSQLEFLLIGKSNPLLPPAVAVVQHAFLAGIRVSEINETHSTPTEPISMSLKKEIVVFIDRQSVCGGYPRDGL
jgi:hypothetical protein